MLTARSDMQLNGRPRVSRASHAGNRRSSPRGLGMVELLICLSISSMLLTAVAIAFRSSFNSYRDSQARGQMLNNGRELMSDLIADIRMADAGGPYDPNSTVWNAETAQFNNLSVPGTPTPGLPAAGGSGTIGLQLAKTHSDAIDPTASPASPVIITYWYDATNKQVWQARQIGGTTTQNVVCTCVQSFTVYLQPVMVGVNAQAGTSASVSLLRAVVTATVANKDSNGQQIIASGDQNLTLTFCDSAMPRRNFGGI